MIMDRYEKAEALEQLTRFYPDSATRDLHLNFFSDALEYAHNAGPAAWGITQLPDRIRLLVGRVVVCTLHQGRLWVAMDKGSITEEMRSSLPAALPGLEWNEDNYTVIPSYGAYYLPPVSPTPQDHQILQAHRSLIDASAEKNPSLVPGSRRSHSPGVLEALSEILHRPLPSPAYAWSKFAERQREISRRQEAQLEAEGDFDLGESLADARDRTVASIVRRRGQPEFRRQLMIAYDRKCAISGCPVEEVLEAAHIIPYRGPKTNHAGNGLLLRGDLHTLFDLGLITIDPSSLIVRVSVRLRGTPYEQYGGQPLRLPHSSALQPSLDALRRHASAHATPESD